MAPRLHRVRSFYSAPAFHARHPLPREILDSNIHSAEIPSLEFTKPCQRGVEAASFSRRKERTSSHQ